MHGDSGPEYTRENSMSKRVVVLYATVLLSLLALMAYFAFTVGTDRADWTRVAERMHAWGGQTWSPVLLVLCYYAGSLLSMPGLVMLTVLVTCLGPALGLSIAMTGTVASASTVHALARKLGRTLLTELYPTQLARAEQLLRGPPLLRVLQMRLLPVLPFHLVNALAGLVGIELRAFVLGTVMGLGPKMLVELQFVRALLSGLTAPGTVFAANVAVSLVLFAIVTLIGVWIERHLRKS